MLKVFKGEGNPLKEKDSNGIYLPEKPILSVFKTVLIT
jgi:hypothetical protein